MNLAEIRKKAGKPQEAVPVNHSQPLSFTDMPPGPPRETQVVEEPAYIEPLLQEPSAEVSLPQPESPVPVPDEQPVVAEPVMTELPMVEPTIICEEKNIGLRPVTNSDYDPLAVLLAGREAVLADLDDSLSVQDDMTDTTGENMAEFLCFRVSDEHYAVNIMEIKEIIKPRETTEVPRAPDYVAGVLSLRGVIIPIFDMRKRLGLPDMAATGKERIIVVKKEDGFCGILVDEVVQVARIPLSGIEPAPPVLDGIDRDFVSGIGRCEGTMIILLSMEHILDLTLA